MTFAADEIIHKYDVNFLYIKISSVNFLFIEFSSVNFLYIEISSVNFLYIEISSVNFLYLEITSVPYQHPSRNAPGAKNGAGALSSQSRRGEHCQDDSS